MAGNIGLPVLDALRGLRARGGYPEPAVLELSSYQLETTSSLRARRRGDAEPHARTTSIAIRLDGRLRPREGAHLPRQRHAGAEPRRSRRASPWRARRQAFTFGLDAPPGEREWGLDAKRESLVRGDETAHRGRAMAMPGLHNAANALAAHALARAIGIAATRRSRRRWLEFKGLPHRVQEVAAIGGVRFYDDSKGTNVGATRRRARRASPIRSVLIAGGDGKGQDFAPLAPAVEATRAPWC